MRRIPKVAMVSEWGRTTQFTLELYFRVVPWQNRIRTLQVVHAQEGF